MINKILHLLSFYMKFMKLAKGLFHKFHMKIIFCLFSATSAYAFESASESAFDCFDKGLFDKTLTDMR